MKDTEASILSLLVPVCIKTQNFRTSIKTVVNWQCFKKLKWNDIFTLGLQRYKNFAKNSYNGKMPLVRRLKTPSDRNYVEKAGIFQYFVTFSPQKNQTCGCIIGN